MTGFVIFLLFIAIAVALRVRQGEVTIRRQQGRKARAGGWSEKLPFNPRQYWRSEYWKVLVGIGICHALVAFCFTTAYLFLAYQPMFWLDHAIIAIAATVLTDKVDAKVPYRGMRWEGLAVLAILFICNVREVLHLLH